MFLGVVVVMMVLVVVVVGSGFLGLHLTSENLKSGLLRFYHYQV